MKIEPKVKNIIGFWRLSDTCKIWVSKSKQLAKISKLLIRIKFQKGNEKNQFALSEDSAFKTKQLSAKPQYNNAKVSVIKITN